MKIRFICIVLALTVAMTPVVNAEGALPALIDVYGVPMPSLGDILQCYPDEIIDLPDNAKEQHWSDVSDEDFEAFGNYLGESEAELQDYRVVDGVFEATVGKAGRSFSFSYNPTEHSAVITYPADVYDQRMYEAESKYNKGMDLLNEGLIEEARTAFMSISNYMEYKDTEQLITDIKKKIAVKYVVGNYVTFGSYPQTASGSDSTPIEWLVLDRDGSKVLLISRYGLDAQPYNTDSRDITWDKCALRKWLNGTFMNKAFISEEQAAIVLTDVDNSESQGYSEWSTSGGNDTKDRVFLLSYAEANKYLGVTYDDSNNTMSRVTPTAWAAKAGAYTGSSDKTAEGSAAAWWWLRSPGYIQLSAALVLAGGSLYYNSVIYTSGCVRPALWIDLESDFFRS